MPNFRFKEKKLCAFSLRANNRATSHGLVSVASEAVVNLTRRVTSFEKDVLGVFPAACQLFLAK